MPRDLRSRRLQGGGWTNSSLKAVLAPDGIPIHLCDTSKELKGATRGVDFLAFANGTDITMGYGAQGKPFKKVILGNFKRLV